MKFTIKALQINPVTNPITGCLQVNPDGPSGEFHSLEDAAKFVVASYSTDGTWFGLADDFIDPAWEHDHVLAVLWYAVPAAKLHPDDWPATVARCIHWMEYEKTTQGEAKHGPQAK